jgi:response regulator RpfG family c-di-GMP phosphodiesterase
LRRCGAIGTITAGRAPQGILKEGDGSSMADERTAHPLATEDLRILVVDDRRSNAELLQILLRRWGYRDVRITSESSEVAELVRRDAPDLLLLDLHMPAPDGFAVMESLREQITATVSLPVLVLTGDATEDVKRRALADGARDFVTKPFDHQEVRLRVRNLLDIRRLQLEQHSNALELEERVRARTAELEEARLEVLERLATAGEFRDDETGEHARRVGAAAQRLADAVGLAEAGGERMRVAAPLHDIGKIAIPDALLLKAGRFSRTEHTAMQRHTVIGADMLAGTSSGLLALAREIALTHHERWDGSGYPAGLAGEDIPKAGRIVALADVFDALTHRRPYKEAWPVEEAVREIRAQGGRQFDPDLAEAFAELDHEVPVPPA